MTYEVVDVESTGRYGPQAGDGIPTVSRAEAEASIVAALTDFLGRVA